jgi:hypothetical protein
MTTISTAPDTRSEHDLLTAEQLQELLSPERLANLSN